MQSAAEPDTILISENTYRLAANLFNYEDKGKIAVKGKTEPIQVYRVISEKWAPFVSVASRACHRRWSGASANSPH
jgi:class 3 adenylate cyclase